ncbi:MAG: tetratricopeptide repeat protein [Candidatus Omnitrophica bacterium]|nr:tetratricopeptide repeat protein [Candidatus Omnitrophota bacterium]
MILSPFAYLFLIVVGLLLYCKTFAFDLVFLDDNVWILDYKWFFQDTANALKIFTGPDFISQVFYRPILNLTFFLDARFSQGSILSYRISNIILHLTNICLLMHLLCKLKYGRQKAFCFSLLFSVHPVLTQAVAWIPGRTDSLLAVFVLLSFINMISFVEKEKRLYLFLHWLFFIFALLTKETAVSFALCCSLYLCVIADKRQRSRSFKTLIPLWIVTLGVWFFVRSIIIDKKSVHDLAMIFSSLLKNSPSLITYLGKTILPVNLSVLPVIEDTKLVYGLVVLFLFVVLLFLSKKKRINYVLFGFSWFILFLLPALAISFITHEYRLYLPIIGIIFLILELDIVDTIGKKPLIASVFVLCIAGIFSASTLSYCENYSGRDVFWSNAVETSPHSPLAQRNMGVMLHFEGRLDEAEKFYNKALELNQKEPMVNNNLGLIYYERKEFAAAEKFFKREIEIDPSYDNVYYNLAILYYHIGNKEEASEMWEKAFKLNPKNIEACKNLVAHYFNQKDIKRALFYVEQLRQRGVFVPDALMQENSQ